MYFRNYRPRKTWLFIFLDGAVSEDPSAVDRLKGPKHCQNLHGNSFIMFFHHSERTSVGKSLS